VIVGGDDVIFHGFLLRRTALSRCRELSPPV
jgi:hypothetical protein